LSESPAMNTTKVQPQQEQIPPVQQSPLPELAEFLAPMRVHFTPTAFS
jgi:hypothetical protein